MADSRFFAKMDVGYFDNPKIAELVDDHLRVIAFHFRAILYARQHLTDGVVPARLVSRMVGATWCGEQCGEQCSPHCVGHCAQQNGQQCDVCVAIRSGLVEWVDGDGRVYVHDYLKHQESAAATKDRSAQARRAANARHGKNPPAASTAPRNAASTAPRNAASTAPCNAASSAEERRGEEKKEQRARLARFDDFWALYPKKKNIGDARKAWATAVKTTDPDVIIDGLSERLPWFAAQVKPDGDYRPGGGTWLRNERWTDEIEQPRLQIGGDFLAYRDAPRPPRPVFHDDD